ncbi:MAG: response regulator transcription factor [Synechococcaceae cyanobacterium]|nr:response regulator transcription factor [Synechococcaceae cyanobacterium]
MDFTSRRPQLRERVEHLHTLLQHCRVVVCHGSRMLLQMLLGGIAPGPVVGAATTEAEGLALVRSLKPDLLVVGDRLEQGSGVELVLQVKRRWPGLRCLMLVSQALRQLPIQRAIAAGCNGVLLESALGHGQELQALRSVRDGHIWIDQRLAALAQAPASGIALPLQPLSERELGVLREVMAGRTNAEIARLLILSIETVKSHLRSLLTKLQARDRTQAAVRALQLGLLDGPDGSERR